MPSTTAFFHFNSSIVLNAKWQFGLLWVATNKSEERLCSTFFSVVYFRSSFGFSCKSVRIVTPNSRRRTNAMCIFTEGSLRCRSTAENLSTECESRMAHVILWQREWMGEREKENERESEIVVRNANENHTKINGLMMWAVEQYAQWIESLTMNRSQWSAAAIRRSARP